MDAELADFARAAWPRLVRAAVFLGAPRDRAEDLAESALVTCSSRWRRIRRLGEDPHAVAGSALLAEQRSAAPAPPEDFPFDSITEDPEALERAAAVLETVRSLPAPRREAVVRRSLLERAAGEDDAFGRLVRDSAALVPVGEPRLASLARRHRAAAVRRTRFAVAGACVLALPIGWGVVGALTPDDSPSGEGPTDFREATRACVADPTARGDLTMVAPLAPGRRSPEAAARTMAGGPHDPPGGQYRPVDVQEGDVVAEASRDGSRAEVALLRSDGTLYTVLVTGRDEVGGWHVQAILDCREPAGGPLR